MRGWRRSSLWPWTAASCGRTPATPDACRAPRNGPARTPRERCASISPIWTARRPAPRAACARRPRRCRSTCPAAAPSAKHGPSAFARRAWTRRWTRARASRSRSRPRPSASRTSPSPRAGWRSGCARRAGRRPGCRRPTRPAARGRSSPGWRREVEAHAPLIDRRHRTGAIGRAPSDGRRAHPGRLRLTAEASGTRTGPQGAVLKRYSSEEHVQRRRASRAASAGRAPSRRPARPRTMRAPRAARPTRRSASGSEPARAPRPSVVRCGCARPSSPCSATIRAPRRAVPPPAEGPARRRRAGRARRHRPQPRAHGPVDRPPIVEGRDGGVGTPLGGRLGGTARAEPTRQQPTTATFPRRAAPRTFPTVSVLIGQ